jgi:hypothetical protein
MSIREILVKHGALQFSVNPVAMEELKTEILKGLPKKAHYGEYDSLGKGFGKGFNSAILDMESHITELFEETK